MNKLRTLVLVVIMSFALTSCSVSGEEIEYGKNYDSNGIEFRINYCEFENFIDVGGLDTYWQGMSLDSNGNLHLENMREPKIDGDVFFISSFTVKNNTDHSITINECGKLRFNHDESYSSGGLTYRQADSSSGWKDVDGGVIIGRGDDEYEFRVFISVPEEIATSNESLTYTLLNKTFRIR